MTAESEIGTLTGLRAVRNDVGLSQLDLAEKAGVAYRTVQNAEAGRIVNSHTLVKLADALGVPASALMEGER